jgi:MFS transporter, DHA1 family, tetracycline resistance protein
MLDNSGGSSKALTFIFCTVLIDVTGLGIIIPVLPQLIQEISGLGLSKASQLAGFMGSSFSLMLFFFAPIMGGLSDRYGRRPVLLLSLFGFGLDYILQAFAPTIMWLFIGRVLAGITGSSFSVAASYIADVSEPDKRAQNFGLLGAAFGLGFIIGPAIGALLGQYGLRIPFFGAAFLAFCNLGFGYFVVPESLKLENRRPFDWKRANPFGTLRVLSQYPMLKGFILTLFLVYIAHYSLQSTWSFYTMEKFQWDAKMIGISLSVVGLMAAIVQGGLTRIIIPRIGHKKSISCLCAGTSGLDDVCHYSTFCIQRVSESCHSGLGVQSGAKKCPRRTPGWLDWPYGSYCNHRSIINDQSFFLFYRKICIDLFSRNIFFCSLSSCFYRNTVCLKDIIANSIIN